MDITYRRRQSESRLERLLALLTSRHLRHELVRVDLVRDVHIAILSGDSP